ncbi:ABC transporter ATP-binding protein [Candidatus Puniceispirillum sp.]|nr:ABC transporter ATP-binding protein [Candidatus Puniceispirillum sp.]
MPHIQAISLSKSYSGKSALADFSFEAGDSELIGILGANGAGKSTLIKLLAGVIEPDSGNAILNGHSIRQDRRTAQAQIGYLPESPSGFDDITVYEFLSFSANAHGIYGREIIPAISKICEELDLDDVKYMKLSNLSKGWRQRAWLGQALVHNPSLLFLDEPTDGFDPIQKIAIRQHIKFIAKGRTILMSTHILEEAEAICDQIMIMKSGRLVEYGDTSSFLDKHGRLEQSMIAFAT